MRITTCSRLTTRFFSMSSNSDIVQSLQAVQQKVQDAIKRTNRERLPRLVGVSKTKPVETLQAAYDAGLRVFGENYVQEIIDKAPLLPEDIQWHFIGHIQSNKVKKLIEGVPNLAMVETCHSIQLATKLNQVLESLDRAPLEILIQVNTSGEDSKSGVDPKDVVEIARFIHNECDRLQFSGLMTIGVPDSTSERPVDFIRLLECRNEVCAKLELDPEQIEVSMGMSGDYEQAIEMGSTNVRVGSAIFGARSYPKQAIA